MKFLNISIAVHSHLAQCHNNVWVSCFVCFRCRGLVPSPHPKVSYGLPSQEPQVGVERQILGDKVKEGTVNNLSRKLLTSEGSDCWLRSFNLCLNSSSTCSSCPLNNGTQKQPLFTKILQGLETNALWTSSFRDWGTSSFKYWSSVSLMYSVNCCFQHPSTGTGWKTLLLSFTFFVGFTPIWALLNKSWANHIRCSISVELNEDNKCLSFSSSTVCQWKSGMGCHAVVILNIFL